MSARIPTVLLWLFVMNLGVAFGAGLYEQRIVVPEWLTASGSGIHWNGEAARRDDTGRRFWVFVTTVPLTILTLANIGPAWRSAAPVRRWWVAAVWVAIVDRATTFGYFIPTMIWLAGAPDSSQSVAVATQWATANNMRHALVLTAWLCSLKTFWLLARHGSSHYLGPHGQGK